MVAVSDVKKLNLIYGTYNDSWSSLVILLFTKQMHFLLIKKLNIFNHAIFRSLDPTSAITSINSEPAISICNAYL